jgi:hypothetical protein
MFVPVDSRPEAYYRPAQTFKHSKLQTCRDLKLHLDVQFVTRLASFLELVSQLASPKKLASFLQIASVNGALDHT